MTLRDEFWLQRFLLSAERHGRILLSPHMYRQVRHHPHFRFFMHRFARHSIDTHGLVTLPRFEPQTGLM